MSPWTENPFAPTATLKRSLCYGIDAFFWDARNNYDTMCFQQKSATTTLAVSFAIGRFKFCALDHETYPSAQRREGRASRASRHYSKLRGRQHPAKYRGWLKRRASRRRLGWKSSNICPGTSVLACQGPRFLVWSWGSADFEVVRNEASTFTWTSLCRSTAQRREMRNNQRMFFYCWLKD